MSASSCCRIVDCARQEWAQSNDVFAAIRLSCKNCVGTATYGFLSLSHRYAMPAPPSGGAKERTVVTLSSSDEEGADAVGGRRDNAHSALCRLTGSSACGAKERTVVTLPSSDEEGADVVGGRRDNVPAALPRTPYPRKNPAPRSWNSASETPSSSSRCAFGSSAGTPNSSCIL